MILKVFVVEKENYIDFMQELLTDDSKYKCIECIKVNKQSFIEVRKKEMKDNETSGEKDKKNIVTPYGNKDIWK